MDSSDDSLQQKVPDPQPGKAVMEPKVQLERRQQLERAIRENHGNVDQFLELGRLYRDEHRPLEAKRVLAQAAKIFPDNDDVQWQLEEAILARSLQQFREANDLASRVNSAEADEELVRSQRDWIRQRIEICTARLKRDASLKHLCVILSEAHFDAGDFQNAIDAVQPALSCDDYSPQAFLMRARSELALGESESALKSLRLCALRREIIAPPKIRLAALRLLCDTARTLGLTATLKHYEKALHDVQSELQSDTAGS
ncbi:tetratricopeptide repeat protein [Crateriforma spongiae]|uniref:tetratricopeptide repeat protein n=1 Tax=Crateriforma spongiae TaxID=2724528 RepID=UPI001445E15F|nr:hypothetical protein [Crateriforma spongiae]